MRSRRILVGSLSATIVLAIAVGALAEEGVIGQEIIPAKRVGIKNLDDSTTVNFSLKQQGEDRSWVKYSLTPGQDHELQCGDVCSLRMTTTGKPPVTYRLQTKKRYAISWGADAELWEVHVVE